LSKGGHGCQLIFASPLCAHAVMISAQRGIRPQVQRFRG
jgi:hypothetical protein